MENVVIIGGGPAGLSAGIYLARAGLRPLVFAGSAPGGQLTLTSEVENYPGFELILGPALVEKMRKQAEKFGAEIIDQNITKVDFTGSSLKVYMPDHSRQNFVSSSAVIIATGARALWLNVPGEQRLIGKGVSACAICDGFFFRDKTVAVVGGGDTALAEALTLTKFAKKVYLIHRRDSFRASKIMQERVGVGHDRPAQIKNSKIEVIYNTVVEEIIGKDKVTGLKIKSQKSKVKNTSQNLKVDGIFIAIGHKPDTDLFRDKVEIDDKGYIITNTRKAIEMAALLHGYIARKEKSWFQQFNNEAMKQFSFSYQSATSVPGVFAAGDCVDYQYRQVAVAAGSGVVAALEVEKWLESA